jgi:dTDP-4-dehydrorhamnose 3,5-epimerase
MRTRVIDLQIIETRDKIQKHQNGNFVPLYRNWDRYVEEPVSMIYTTSCFSREVKGPHLHKKRRGHLTVLKGEVVFVLEYDDGYEEIQLNGDVPRMIVVPEGTVNAHVNIGNEEALVMNICTRHCWKSDDTDNYDVEFRNYDLRGKWL